MYNAWCGGTAESRFDVAGKNDGLYVVDRVEVLAGSVNSEIPRISGITEVVRPSFVRSDQTDILLVT